MRGGGGEGERGRAALRYVVAAIRHGQRGQTGVTSITARRPAHYMPCRGPPVPPAPSPGPRPPTSRPMVRLGPPAPPGLLPTALSVSRVAVWASRRPLLFLNLIWIKPIYFGRDAARVGRRVPAAFLMKGSACGAARVGTEGKTEEKEEMSNRISSRRFQCIIQWFYSSSKFHVCRPPCTYT